MTSKSDSVNERKVFLRVGVLALLALAVAGVVYLRQGTLSQPGAASEALEDLTTTDIAQPVPSISPPEPALAGVVPPGDDPGIAEPSAGPVDRAAPEGVEPATEERLSVPEEALAPAKPLPKLLDLGADKCIPCKQMAPILDELRVEYAGVFEVVFIDVWKNSSEADKYRIRIIPTQIFYDASGKELFRHTGFYSKEQILAKWRELGVDVGGR
ncbi:MAG: hypothetical protein Kow0097_03410 [Candidatus Bipolaricaulota bacterium]